MRQRTIDLPQVAVEPPAEAQAAFDKAMDGLDGTRYISAALLSTQVVAGIKHCILCQAVPETPDAAPTLLELMGLEKPKEMTGESLLIRKKE